MQREGLSPPGLGRAPSPNYAGGQSHRILLALVLLCAGILRFYHIGFQDFWRDEAFSLVLSRQELVPLWNDVVKDFVHPPLYYLMLHVWMKVAGDAPVQARALSALFGCLSVLAAYGVGRLAYGRNAGLLGAALFAVSWMDVKYSQETRPYEVATFWVLAALGFFLAALRQKGTAWWWLFAGSSALAMYTHYYAGFVLLGVLLWSATAGRKYVPALRWWIAGGVVAVLPLATWMTSGVVRRALESTKLMTDSSVGSAALKWWSVGSTINYFNGGKWSGEAAQTPLWMLLLGVLVLTAPVALALLRSRREQTWEGHVTLLLGAVVLVPLTVVLALGLFGVQYFPRYVLFGLAPYYLLAIRGMLAYRNHWGRVGAVVAAMLFQAPALWSNYHVPFKMALGDGLKYLAEQYRPGDCIAFNRTRTPRTVTFNPPLLWFALRMDRAGMKTIQLNPQSEDAAEGCQRLWAVYEYSYTGAIPAHEKALMEKAAGLGERISERRFDGIVVSLWRLPNGE
jgi:mannosyltransferase